METTSERSAADERRAALLAELGITMTATFVPQSRSRNATEKRPSLNWHIVVSSKRGTLATDYMQGIGNLPGYSPAMYDRSIHASVARKRLERAAETGMRPTRFDSEYHPGNVPVTSPSLPEVMQSLLLDGEASEMLFPEWCESYGLDTDSRTAEAMYQTCAQIGLLLRRIAGGPENITRLRDAFQDY